MFYFDPNSQKIILLFIPYLLTLEMSFYFCLSYMSIVLNLCVKVLTAPFNFIVYNNIYLHMY